MSEIEKKFEEAMRVKLRWNLGKGPSLTESLFDLSVEKLDEIYGDLTALEDSIAGRKSLISVEPQSAKSYFLELRIGIVEHIIITKQAEEEARKDKVNADKRNSRRRQRVLGLIEEKQDADLDALSIDELLDLAAESR